MKLIINSIIIVYSAKIREAHEKDIREYKRSLVEDRPRKRESKDIDITLHPSESRRSTCAACSQKWKEPLPSPKLPYLRKNSKRLIDDNVMKCFLSKSTYMITNMIKEEIEQMERRERELKYEKREKKREPWKPKPNFRNDVSKKTSSFTKISKSYSPYYGYKPQESTLLMNNLNLAKIKNQISAKECDVKVKKFLDEPICIDTICGRTKLY